MKAWSDVGPDDLELVRIESTIESVAMRARSLNGVKTFESLRVDALPDCEVDGLSTIGIGSRPVDCGSFDIEGAAATNSKRQTVILSSPRPSRVTMPLDCWTWGGRIGQAQSNYDGYNVILEAYSNYDTTYDAEYRVRNLTTGFDTGVVSVARPPAGQVAYYFVNAGRGAIDITLWHGTFPVPRVVGWTPPYVCEAHVRRARYPIVEGDPVRVMNADFTAYEKRLITEADVAYFRTA